VIRARAGWYPVPQMWHEFASQMPRGVDALTVESLDAVSRRGIYWGGAIFMLLADLDIRERSHGRASLETCLRAVLEAGGDTTVRWPREKFLRVCDAATGTGTMARLSARYVAKAAPLDLDGLWRDLGVKLTADGVQFDDAAPKAALRRAITAGG
jgi:predicted metalloprotease with PDZ domain